MELGRGLGCAGGGERKVREAWMPARRETLGALVGEQEQRMGSEERRSRLRPRGAFEASTIQSSGKGRCLCLSIDEGAVGRPLKAS